MDDFEESIKIIEEEIASLEILILQAYRQKDREAIDRIANQIQTLEIIKRWIKKRHRGQ